MRRFVTHFLARLVELASGASPGAAWGLWCALAVLVVAPPLARAEVDFYRDVYPILNAKCISCHNKTKAESNLNLETPETIRAGGDSGPGVSPGKSAESLIFVAAAHTGDMVMPPKNNKPGAAKLTPAEISLLAAWIDAGAKSSVRQAQKIVWQTLQAGVHPIYSAALTPEGRWAACGRGNQLFLYDLATRQFVARLSDDALGPAPKSQAGGRAHQGLVQSLAFSPDGQRLASGSYREVKIWKQAAGVASQPPLTPNAALSALTPDGKTLVCIDQTGGLHVFDLAGGKLLRLVPAAAPGASLLAVSPDGMTAAASGPQSISLWNLQTGESAGTIPAPGAIVALTWTPDSKRLAGAGKDKIVRLWERPADPGKETPPPVELAASSPVVALAWATQPDRLLAAAEDGQVQVWGLPEGKPLSQFKIAGVRAMAASRDGKQLAAGLASGAVQVWDPASAKVAVELSGDCETQGRLSALNWQAAAQQLELASLKQDIARLDTEHKVSDEVQKKAHETLASVAKVLPEREAAVKEAETAQSAAQAALDALAAKLAAAPGDAALDKEQKDLQQKLKDAQTQTAAAQMALKASQHHRGDAQQELDRSTAAKARNAELAKEIAVAVATAQKALEQVSADLNALKQAQSKRSLRPLAVAFSADAQFVAAAYENGEQRVWAIASGASVAQVTGVQPTTSAAIVSAARAEFFTALPDGALARVNACPDWRLERTLGGATTNSPLIDRVNALRFSPDGKLLAAGSGEPSRSGDISLWDAQTGALVANWNDRHADAVLGLDFSPDGKLLASGGADKLARVTDLANGEQMRLYEGHTHHVMGVAFRSDGRTLATAGADGTVLIWDMAIGERKKKIEGWSKEVTALQYLGATGQLATSAGDNQVRIVSDEGAQVRALSGLPEFMHAVAASSGNGLLVAGGQDGILRVWESSSGKELVQFAAP